MRWYLSTDPPASAEKNMAKDEYCLRRAIELGRPILRLYQWQAMTLSLGRNQKPERQIDLEGCARNGVGLVRRVTGGQAVLHGSDLTYSVTAPLRGAGFEGGIMAIYREISRAMVAFFEELGLEPEVKAYTGRERVEMASPVCFATPSAYEIMIRGRKLVGSAQRLLPDGFLQHGSIPLRAQTPLLARVFLGASEDALEPLMTDLDSLGLGALSVEVLQQKLAAAFMGVFGASGEPLPWGQADEAAVAELAEQYRYWPENPPAAGQRGGP